jgi:CYTH domain-containing protein
MNTSITRKFLVKELPDLSNTTKEIYQRYYLFTNETTVIRIQAVNDRYEIERKVDENNLIRNSQTIQITKDEFDHLKKYAQMHIERESYDIEDNPKIVLRIYKGKYEGLNRAEVNFTNEEDANTFIPYAWFSKEITGTPLAQDGNLLQLTIDEFNEL